MNLEEYLSLVRQLAPNFDRAAAMRFYNNYRKECPEMDMLSARRYIENNLPDKNAVALCKVLEEYGDIYKHFSEVAAQEGFTKISADFKQIAEIEKTHANRFSHFADLLEQNKLFISDVTCKWMCLNCGNVIETTKVPEKCPVCDHDKGYFIRLELAPYTCK
jgi:rubrerythrin